MSENIENISNRVRIQKRANFLGITLAINLKGNLNVLDIWLDKFEQEGFNCNMNPPFKIKLFEVNGLLVLTKRSKLGLCSSKGSANYYRLCFKPKNGTWCHNGVDLCSWIKPNKINLEKK